MERPKIEEAQIITEEQRRDAKRRLAKAMLKKSPLEGIRGGTCPTCNQPTFDYSDDLIYESYHTGERVVITGLTGLRCRRCGAQAYDLRSTGIIERVLEDRVPGGYECTITKLGGERLGVYLPKDVVREMDIEPKQKAIIKLLSRRRMIIEVRGPR
jgi:hypothetical protein